MLRGEDVRVREWVAVGAKAVAVARRRRERKVRNMVLLIYRVFGLVGRWFVVYYADTISGCGL